MKQAQEAPVLQHGELYWLGSRWATYDAGEHVFWTEESFIMPENTPYQTWKRPEMRKINKDPINGTLERIVFEGNGAYRWVRGIWVKAHSLEEIEAAAEEGNAEFWFAYELED